MTSTLANTQYKALRAAFLLKLESKLDIIEEELLCVIQSEEFHWNYVEQLHATVHKFVGSTGIYGLAGVAEAGTTLLDWTYEHKSSSTPLTEQDKTKLSQYLEDLKSKVFEVLHEKADQQESLQSLISSKIEIPPVNPFSTISVTKGHVFIVDDDKEQAEALKFYLTQAGFDATTFASLEEVEKALEELKPSAIVMDMMFPQGEFAGAEMTSKLQQLSEGEWPVLILSARRDILARLEASRAGASHYFTKPVDISRMIVELNKISRTVKEEDCRILLIDDDPDITRLIGLHLEKVGFQVEIINDPMDALEAIDHFDPELVLVDLHMPDCNGLELVKIIRQHEIYHDLPLMFLTSETNPQAKIDAITIGSDDFFQKQLDSDLLVEALKARLKRIRNYARVKKATMWSP